MNPRGRLPQIPKGWTEEGLCAGLSLLGSVAIFELLDKPAPRALAALLISAAVGFGAGRWIVRSRHPRWASAVSAIVLVAVIVDASVSAPWHHLLVNEATWHAVASALRSSADRTLLAACVLVGVAGASERVAFGDRGRSGTIAHPALAVLPAFVLVTWSAAVERGSISGALCVGLIGVGGLAVLAGDQQKQSLSSDSAGATRTASRQRGIQLALVAALGSGSRGRSLGGWKWCVGYRR